MLKALTIHDLAVIRALDVEFADGLTILTGETGAGKSILVEALGLALGDRADSGMVRSGAARATVTATFDIAPNAPLREFLRDHDLEDDADECILRRVMNADGRSRAFCNASPVPVQTLKQIGELLVDIHGQHAHHSLLRRPVMRAVLDEYAGHDDALAAVASAHGRWRELNGQLQALTDGAEDVAGRIDLLRFQADELAALDLTEDGLATLEADHRRVANAARIIEACDEAASMLFDDDASTLAAAVRAAGELKPLAAFDERVGVVTALLDDAAIQLEEAGRELARVRSDVDNDPERLRQIEHELGTIHDLARKHRIEPVEIPARLAALRAELESLEGREAAIADVTAGLEAASRSYAAAATSLHEARAKAAAKLAKEITRRLRELGIPHGKFAVDVSRNDAPPSAYGDDDVEFLVTANPDQPLAPLRKVASGGELSRVSLAIQVATTGRSAVPVLVFDEVDMGIGGPTADVVSDYLCALGEHRQILCITHLPQVASAGAQHLVIGKQVRDGATETTLRSLEADERIEEIARMLAGQKVTQTAREHARELLAS